MDIAGVQGTKWKRPKAKMLGDGFKLFYLGETHARNVVNNQFDQIKPVSTNFKIAIAPPRV